MKIFNFYKNNENIQIAHRGHSLIRPENTLCAFEASLEKTKMIELDIAFSSDGIAVVIHDDTCERTSNVADIFPKRKNSFIHEFTLKELKSLDFSSWFINTDPYESIKKGLVKKEEIKLQKISTLEEILIFCKENNMAVNVEIKDLKETPFHKKAVDEVVCLIKKHKMQDDTIISSFNGDYILEINEKYPQINKAFLLEEEIQNLEEFLIKNNIQALHCCNEIINKKLVQSLLKHDIYTCVFTVNEIKRKKELFSWGVKAVFTDVLV